jgi:putative membrane protein
LILLALLSLLAVSLIRPPYPDEQWLQHLPTVASLVGLAVAARRSWFSTTAFAALAAMLALHIVGARWIYSFVPYDAWCQAIVGSGPRSWFGWDRNHYDRLVHLAFGLLMPLPIAEAAQRFGGQSSVWALATALLAVATISAVYEVAEWLLAVIAAPDFAEAYNGQQGDMWDAQKDMALAIVGSVIAAGWLAVSSKRNQPPRVNHVEAR